MILKDFCKQFVEPNTSVCLYKQGMAIKGGVKYTEYTRCWLGKDYENSPYVDYRVLHVISNPEITDGGRTNTVFLVVAK